MWQDKLKEIIYILEQSDVNEIDMTFLGRRFRVVKSIPAAPVQDRPAASTALTDTIASSGNEDTALDTPNEETVSGNEVLSPMPGTFYRAPSPEDDLFVQVGDSVKAGDTLCIIEAMKIMNEIEAEESGVVRKILVENAQPVEYNQPLFIVDPNG